ncbi:MAG: proline--tRNA ligase [bacterium]
MRVSKLFMPTMKETPGDAEIISHRLMLRGGFIRKLASGLYEWLPLGMRVLQKVEHIIRREMNNAGGQEVWLPALQPRALWEETGRWAVYGKELMRLKDRHDREFALGPTHEEVITDIVRKEVRSYKQLPLLLYQFQTKFRDEIRPRFGIMRAREFYMKDAYSFHRDEEDAKKMYKKVFDAYAEIFRRCGFKFRSVEALTGAIGGSFSHEFMVCADTGEEGMVSCSCGYAANVEKAEVVIAEKPAASAHQELPLEEVHTPDKKTVAEVSGFLHKTPEYFIKTLIYVIDSNPVMVLVRGDDEVEEHKLHKVLKSQELALADPETIQNLTGAPVGFAGPAGRHIASLKSLTIIADNSVVYIVNGISGANKKDYHYVNINIDRDYKPTIIADIRKIKPGDVCPKCTKELKFSRGIEVGHAFMLGTKYSESMKAVFLDSDGKTKEYVMGCYGIGVSRMVAAAIEQSHDEFGIIWPMPIAPYQVIIIPINYDDAETKKTADKLYDDLLSKNIEVLLDDRPGRAGFKFKDADLIGIPIRITISEKKIKDKIIEVKRRADAAAVDYPIKTILAAIQKLILAQEPTLV